MPKCKKVFKESKEVPSPPFTRNSLTIKRIAKKVKGEGLKTLFYIYAWRVRVKTEKKTLGSKIGKTLKKEYNIKFKIYPSPFTSQKSHQNSVLYATENHLQESVPGHIIRRQFSFGDIILSFGDIFLFIGDIILSFGDNFLFFGNISSNFKIRHKNIIFANFISRIHTIVTNRIAMKQKRMYLCSINHKGWCRYGLVMTAKSGWRKCITTSDIHQNLQPSTIFFSFSR